MKLTILEIWLNTTFINSKPHTHRYTTYRCFWKMKMHQIQFVFLILYLKNTKKYFENNVHLSWVIREELRYPTSERRILVNRKPSAVIPADIFQPQDKWNILFILKSELHVYLSSCILCTSEDPNTLSPNHHKVQQISQNFTFPEPYRGLKLLKS